MNHKTYSEKGLIFTLALVQFIHILDFMVMIPLGPHFIRDFSIDAGQFSFLISAYTLSAGTAGFLGSFFLDKIERKKVFLTLLFGFIVGTLCCALSPSYSLLLISRIVTGLFGGILAATVLSIVGDVIPGPRRGQAMGLIMSAFSVASVVGVPSGLFLSNIFSWTAPFFLIAITGIFTFLISLKTIPILKDHLDGPPASETAIVQTLKNKNQRNALTITLSIMLGQFAVIPLISTYMVTNVGFTEHTLTYIYIIGGLASMVMSPISGKLGDRFGKFPIFMIFSLLSTIPVLTITHMGYHPTLLFPILFTTFLFFCSSGRMVCGMALIISSVGPKQRGGFMSINTSVQQIAAGIAAFIGGLIVHQLPSGQLDHYNIVGYWAVCFAVLSVIAASRVKSVDTSHIPTDVGVAEGAS